MGPQGRVAREGGRLEDKNQEPSRRGSVFDWGWLVLPGIGLGSSKGGGGVVSIDFYVSQKRRTKVQDPPRFPPLSLLTLALDCTSRAC